MAKGFMTINQKLKILRDIIYKEERGIQKQGEMKKLFPLVQFGPGSLADERCTFQGRVNLAANVKLRNCSIGANTYISNNSQLINCDIGRYCSIGPEVLAGLGLHPSKTFVSTHPAFFSPKNASPVSYVDDQKFVEHKRIKIGNDVWIGARVYLIDGINIGDGAILAAGAVVTGDVEPFSIVGGVPAKEIRKRFSEEQIKFLLDLRWWDMGEEWIEAKAHLFDDINKLMADLS